MHPVVPSALTTAKAGWGCTGKASWWRRSLGKTVTRAVAQAVGHVSRVTLLVSGQKRRNSQWGSVRPLVISLPCGLLLLACIRQCALFGVVWNVRTAGS